jgi:hypothetical protein
MSLLAETIVPVVAIDAGATNVWPVAWDTVRFISSLCIPLSSVVIDGNSWQRGQAAHSVVHWWKGG